MIEFRDDKVLYNTEEVQIFCRFSPKFLAYIAHGQREKMIRWVEWNKKLGFNTLEVFAELHAPPEALDNPPGLKGLWPIPQMLNGNRVEDLNDKNKGLIQTLYEISSETEMAFVYTIDATLKNIVGMSSGMIGHAISRTLEFCRKVAETYPRANVAFNFHNGWNTGWNAHAPEQKRVKLGLWELSQQAGRCRRWYKTGSVPKQTKMSFTSPGAGWEPEQYPEAAIMVEEQGGTVKYPTGRGVKQYPITAVQAMTLRPFGMGNYFKPVYLSKTPMVDEDNYYDYVSFMDTMRRRGFHFCVRDLKALATNPDEPTTRFEKYLLGDEPEPPPEPEPPEESWWLRFLRILIEMLKGDKES